jgi:hypothetical protein
MRSPRHSLALFLLASCSAAFCASTPPPPPSAPTLPDERQGRINAPTVVAEPLTRENKPWTRWWWPGSAVNKADLTAQLEKFAAAGLGGVEITPIYGAKGAESRYIDFLSPQWMEMLEHVGREARRLGLGVDMATGTGWPFGGPWIDKAHSIQKIARDDSVLRGEPNLMMVKRAAPGGEGLVIDPYSTEALAQYLATFDRAFEKFPRELLRGQFHDSFEYYGATWTPRLLEVFRELHGYDLQDHAAAFRGAAPVDKDTLARLKGDYRDTLAHLHQDYLHAWAAWAHRNGWVVRNQSHGAPGNLIDLYANADMAETEVFGSTPFPIPGLRRNADEIRHDQDLPEPLVIRLASSASHVSGHRLTSSETCTWLRDHWKVSLAYTKPEIDRLFADGINHIFYHGTVYSPQDAAWPGWLFYASTQFNPSNTWWTEFGSLNAYVARVQAVLQAGRPDNDVLVYWPIEDIWDDAEGEMKQLGMHKVAWITEQPAGRLARSLMAKGYAFDFISDALLARTRAEKGALVTPGGSYSTVLVPATRRMPAATLAKLVELSRQGATVIFEKLPEDVPGLGRLEQRRAQFRQQLAELPSSGALVNADPLAALAAKGIRREHFAELGLSAIRRATTTGHSYFLANLGATRVGGWVPVATPLAHGAILTDPLSGVSGWAGYRRSGKGPDELMLELEPGQSLLITVPDVPGADTRMAAYPSWNYNGPGGAPVALTGTWSVCFVRGGPVLPAALETRELQSWTAFADPELQRFGGTARYTLHFEAPAVKADDFMLDLGDVRESARVRLNGQEVATLWSLPFRVHVGRFLRPGLNTLELEVTNLAANRIRDLDRQGVAWKIMREINLVNINYKPFNASEWPLTPSGLLGPVTLTPLSLYHASGKMP